MRPDFSHIIVIGASAGGVTALLEISAQLERFFPAPICIVQHVGNNPSLLPELLRFRGRNHAMHPTDGQRLTSGTLHVAPPDSHMLVDGDTLRLNHGPKENHSRPAIDPLFRSAALTWGPRVIGVILTGQMDDGAAGLKAIHDCGGITIVQDPETAAEPEMPRSALANVAVDHCVPLEEIGPLLQRLVGSRTPPPAGPVPEEIVREVAINRGEHTMEHLEAIGTRAPLTCPDCGGTLWEMKSAKPLRFRCHTGHAYTVTSLRRSQQVASEEALRHGVRALREREFLLRRVASIAAATGDTAQAEAGLAQADRLRDQMRTVEAMAETPIPDTDENGDA
ncbi:MAG TPA: chemotaxis protein CheB [Ramlibacter sp.]|nr:chemotaxis protein CheB [Ramlibacter sp.]